MAVARILTSTVIVSFMLSTFVLTQDTDGVPEITNNNEKYRGTWYNIGIIWAEPVTLHSCIKHDVILEVGDSISISISAIDEFNSVQQGQITGELRNFKLMLRWFENYASHFTMTEYNNGNELVLCRSPKFDVCAILSRQSTASEKLLDTYRDWAKEKNMLITYVNQSYCP